MSEKTKNNIIEDSPIEKTISLRVIDMSMDNEKTKLVVNKAGKDIFTEFQNLRNENNKDYNIGTAVDGRIPTREEQRQQ